MSEIALPIAGVPPGLPLPGRLLSDERLAKLASAGNARALTVLYERHHQALYRYCRSIVRDHEDAQDALQSTMTHAFIALRSSERDLAVRPWLFRIAHNEAISILRKRRANDCLVDEHLPSEVSVERTVDQRERLRLLIADIQALPVRQRAALLMRAQRPADRGDRCGAVRFAWGGEADAVRGPQLAARVRRGPRDGV
jgi:RNA polymerase sigma factor (sigma-70 family)